MPELAEGLSTTSNRETNWESFSQRRADFGTSTYAPAEEQRETFLNVPNSDRPHAYTSAPTDTSGPTLDQAPSEVGPIDVYGNQVLEAPAMMTVAKIFPQQTCRAIASVDNKGRIRMTFPPSFGHTVMCFMIIEIQANKVERIAMDLFGVCVDVDSGVRCIVHRSGAVSPVPREQHIILQGAAPESVLEILGAAIQSAIVETPLRQGEMEQGIHATRCVSLSIPDKPNANATLELNLGVIRGFEMKNMLFQ